MQITLPGYVNDFLHEIMAEMGFNKSDLLESMVLYVSMPEHLGDFKSQFEIGDGGEEEDENEDDFEEEDDDDDDEDDDPEGVDIIGDILGGSLFE